MEILKRSDDFWKAPKAVAVSETDVMQWIERSIKELQIYPTLEIACVSSGNRMIEVERDGFDESDNRPLYKAFVFTDYEIFKLKG